MVNFALMAFKKISCIRCRALGSTPVVGSSRMATSGGPRIIPTLKMSFISFHSLPINAMAACNLRFVPPLN